MSVRTIESTLDTLRPDHRKWIESQLASGETPLICCFTEFLRGSGYIYESCAYVITPRRLIGTFLNKDDKRISVHSTFFKYIHDIKEVETETTHDILIGSVRAILEPNEVLVKFRSILQDAMYRANEI